jgi:sugar lactone lactonase YvrE
MGRWNSMQSARWASVATLAIGIVASALVGCGHVDIIQNAGTAYTPEAPAITVPPSSQTATVGGSAPFSVTATGTQPLNYQWYKQASGASSAEAIPGAQNSSFLYSGAQLADSGAKITVVVTNIVGTKTSAAATLTVIAAPPSIVQQPQEQSVLVGSSATFVVDANGTAPLRFQWMKNGVAIAGATNASYMTPPTTLADSGEMFDVTVTNAAGSVTSVSALLNVTSPPSVAPTIVTQPQDATAPIGGSASFTVVANGTQPLSYQWQSAGSNIPGATNATYTVSPVSEQNNGSSYAVVVSNSAGTVTSQSATLSVTLPRGYIDLIAGQLGGAGNIDGIGGAARLYQAETVAMDAAGDVWVADTYNCVIREITPSGTVITIAGSANTVGSQDGVGGNALFNYPQGITTDAAGNVYVADTGNQTIRMISPTGQVTTIAGTVGTVGYTNGPGSAALFTYPQGLATDAAGNLYVADSGDDVIRVITTAGIVSTLAGTPRVVGSQDGIGAAALFNHPDGVALDSAGNVYVADTFNSTIRVITPAGAVSTLAGTPGVFGWANGIGAAAQFDHPQSVATDLLGNVFVADTYNDTVREVTPAGVVTTVAGTDYVTGNTDGTGALARFNGPWGIAADAADNLYIADFANDAIRKITPTAVVTTFGGLAPHPGSANGTQTAAQFNAPTAAATDAVGDMYIADSGNDTIRMITPAGVVTTMAGTAGTAGSTDGTGAGAQFNAPQGLAVDAAGNVYVADTGNNTIRKVTPAGVVTTLAGTAGAAGATDGTGPAALFNGPTGIVADGFGNLYVTDTGNDTIRVVAPGGAVTTLAGTAGVVGGADGTGAAAQFNAPMGLAEDAAGNLYVADSQNFTIREVTKTGQVITLAGTAGAFGRADGTGNQARFRVPTGVAVDANDDVYVLDSYYRTVREISPAGAVTTIAGTPGSIGVALGPLPGSFNNPVGIGILPGAAVVLVIPDKGENAVLLLSAP